MSISSVYSQTPTDALVERVISEVTELLGRPIGDRRRFVASALTALVAARSPEQVRRMERRIGLEPTSTSSSLDLLVASQAIKPSTQEEILQSMRMAALRDAHGMRPVPPMFDLTDSETI